MTLASVTLWGSEIGAVSLQADESIATFQYTAPFAASGVPISPLVMPLQEAPCRFPSLSIESFHGLPGLLSDSLPDRYGNALIDAWVARQGRTPGSFDSVERLCYVGRRGMGALEYEPGILPRSSTSVDVEIDALVALATEVLTKRELVATSFDEDDREHAIRELMLVGTSAGGARAKAVIAWNPETNAVRSGQVDAGPGFQFWLLKFDGVHGNRDKELDDPMGFGAIEFAYYLMATAGGISMAECRLMEENGRRHFMSRRFDRTHDGDKLHMQSLAGLAHFDFNLAGAYSYEQALQVCSRLELGMETVEQLFRRMVFNVVARNQDDHVKNIAFLMNRQGEWRLSPAFDVTYAFRPSGDWTGQHQMTLNGKRDNFALSDFRAVARGASMKRGRAEEILEELIGTVARWPKFAAEARVDPTHVDSIADSHRLVFPED